MTRRIFNRLCTVAFGAGATYAFMVDDIRASTIEASNTGIGAEVRQTSSPARTAEDNQLHSEFLLDLVFERGPSNIVGSSGVNRIVVPVSGGTFEGPGLKGTIVGPSGDWMVVRPDGSSVLDIRFVLQTDDGQKIYMTCRGVAYTQPNGTLYARILPVFETGAPKYVWLNNVVGVGVYQSMPKKVAYRIYKIL